MIIPIQIDAQGEIVQSHPAEVEPLTLKDANVKEAGLEEYVRMNIDKIVPDESLLVVGQQTRNTQGGRSDLVAVDSDGNIVLIELKRDQNDAAGRKEPFEFQAIRYAANYALISSLQDLEISLFIPYIDKHKNEFNSQNPDATTADIASERLASLLETDGEVKPFNQKQRIVLVASGFDDQVLSACAWLVRNGIDIKCVKTSLMKYDQQYFFNIEQIIPPPALEDYFVSVSLNQGTSKPPSSTAHTPKQLLPKMPELMKWGLIMADDKVYVRKHQMEEARVVDAKLVKYQGQNITYNEWGKKVTGWSGFNAYDQIVHDKSNKTLDQLRQEKVLELSQFGNDADLALDTTTDANINAMPLPNMPDSPTQQ